MQVIIKGHELAKLIPLFNVDTYVSDESILMTTLYTGQEEKVFLSTVSGDQYGQVESVQFDPDGNGMIGIISVSDQEVDFYDLHGTDHLVFDMVT